MTKAKATIVPVTPFQQNCTLLWCEATKRAVVIDPGGDLLEVERAIARGLTDGWKRGIKFKSGNWFLMSCTVPGIRQEASFIAVQSSVWRSSATSYSPARSVGPIFPEATTSN